MPKHENEGPYDEYIRIFAWALDFCQAFYSRGKIIRRIILFLLGKYARRELVGLFDWLEEYGYHPDGYYELQGTDYHKDGKKWRWG